MKPYLLALPIEVVGLPFRRALGEATKLGVSGIQIDAVGELTPATLTDTGRRELRTLVRSYNLEVSAVRCPLRRGLDSATDLEPRLDRICQAMALATDLGTNRVIVPLPKIAADQDSPIAITSREAIAHLTRHADRIGTLLCFEPGFDPGDKVSDYLASFDAGSLCVNFDPANLLMNGFDPLKALTQLAERIVYTHARDGRVSTVSGGPQEVPVGAGDIDWIVYLATLEAISYRGYLCVERETGDSRFADIASGIRFLRRFIAS